MASESWSVGTTARDSGGRVEDLDPGGLGRRQRMGDEFRRVVGVVDDVDLLLAEFIHHGAHAGAEFADARSLRVDAGLRGAHGEFRAVAGFAGQGHDLDGAVGDLRGLMGEESAHEVRVGAGDGDRGALRALVHVSDVDAQAGAVVVGLAGDLLVRGQHGFDVSDVDLDHLRVTALLDDARDDLALTALERAEQGLVFDIAQPLVDDLPGGLGGDAAEAGGGVVELPIGLSSLSNSTARMRTSPVVLSSSARSSGQAPSVFW